MVNVSVGSGVGHEECVHVGLPEERRNEGDHRGYIEVLGLADLTVMTRSNKPAHIVGKVRPPEPDEKDTGRCEVAFVSELVVSVRDEAISVFGRRNELGIPFWVTAEHLSTSEEVMRCSLKEPSIVGV